VYHKGQEGVGKRRRKRGGRAKREGEKGQGANGGRERRERELMEGGRGRREKRLKGEGGKQRKRCRPAKGNQIIRRGGISHRVIHNQILKKCPPNAVLAYFRRRSQQLPHRMTLLV
jgi:hypothetical protein